MEKLLIDIFGTGLGFYAAIMLFNKAWERKNVKPSIYMCGILSAATVGVLLTTLLRNSPVLPPSIILLFFSLSFFYESGITYKILLSLALVAIIFVSEMIIAYPLVQVLAIPIENAQENMPIYMFGVLTSKLVALFIVLIIRAFMKSSKENAGKQFNLLMAAMPIQSIILCYIVSDYSVKAGTVNNSPLGITAVFLSLVQIFITLNLLEKQLTAMSLKKQYELGQIRLKMQIEHYQNIYQQQQQVKSMRHDMNNNLLAISGMLNSGQTQDAISRINTMSENVVSTSDVVDTGFPPIDAILSAKISKAREVGIDVGYTVFIDDDLNIDQFDIAVIIASALDNAIEGTQRSTDVDKEVTLSISRVADYISILVENNASGPIYGDYQTSKPDNKNHGFGMKQMREVTEKYNGSFCPSYDSEAGRFSLKVMLNNH